VIDSSAAGRAAVAPLAELKQFWIPLGLPADASTVVSILNSGDLPSDVTLSLRTAGGQTLASASRTANSRIPLREPLLSLFNIAAAAVPVDAFIQGTATSPVKISVFEPTATTLEEIPAYLAEGQRRFLFPFFAVGSGFNTIVSMVNTSVLPARVTLTPVQSDGTLFPNITPVVRVIPGGQRADIDLASVFATVTQLTVGSFMLNDEVDGANNPFASPPILAAVVRMRTAKSSAITPLNLQRAKEFLFTPAAETSTEYTGLAVMNVNDFIVNVTITIYSPGGSTLGTTTFALNGQSMRARLLRELVSAANGVQEFLVRVTADGFIESSAFRGVFSTGEVLYLHGQ
jgi:hypothetical protein